MAALPFYRPLTGELCQGDIFECVPLVWCKDSPVPLKKASFGRGREGYEEDAAPGLTNRIVAAACDLSRAVLLTYDCEIDKPKVKNAIVALIRPLGPLPQEDQTRIRENRKYAFFHLLVAEGQPEAYVDFRRLATLGTNLLKDAPRVCRLSEEARLGMLTQFFRFLTRIDLSGVSLPPALGEAAE